MKRLWFATLIILYGTPAASAQVAPSVWPRCIPARDGQQVGVGGSMCECRYESGGTMLRRPAGWRWSCDVMQMDGSANSPAGALNAQSSLLPGVVYAPQGNGVITAAPQQQRGQLQGPVALFDGNRRH